MMDLNKGELVVLKQLLTPVWAGYIISKEALQSLVKKGLVQRGDRGWSFLTEKGVLECESRNWISNNHASQQGID